MQPFITQTVFEDSSLILFGRGKSPGGSYFQQSDFSSIKLKVFDSEDPSAPILSEITLTISAVIFNSLQTADSRWTADSTGYNFRYIVPASHLPAGGKRYRFEFKFTPQDTTYDPFYAVFEVPTLGLYGS